MEIEESGTLDPLPTPFAPNHPLQSLPDLQLALEDPSWSSKPPLHTLFGLSAREGSCADLEKIQWFCHDY